MKQALARNTIQYEMTQRLDRINKQHNGISSRPRLEPRHKWPRGLNKMKINTIARTKWGIYNDILVVQIYVDDITFGAIIYKDRAVKWASLSDFGLVLASFRLNGLGQKNL